MPARAFRCTHCGRPLGTISRKRDHLGKPKDRLRLTENVAKVEHVLFRGKWAECRCGQRVKLPDGVTVEFH